MKSKLAIMLFLLQGNAYATTGIFGPSIFANNGSTATLNSKSISLIGIPDNYKGIIAESGGQLFLGKNAPDSYIKIDLAGNSAVGVYAIEPFSLIQVNSELITIISKGNGNAGLLLSEGGSITLNRLLIDMTGTESVGIQKSGASQLSIDSLSLNLHGDKSIAIMGEGLTDLSLYHPVIFMQGNDSVGVLSNNAQINLNAVSIKSQSGIGLEATAAGVITAEDIQIETGKSALLANHRGVIKFFGTSYIKNGAKDALISEGENSRIVGRGSMMIEGNVSAFDHGSVNLSMENGSLFTGTTTINTSGEISLDLKDSSWTLTGNSSLTHLSLNNGNVYISRYTSGTFQSNVILVNGNYDSDNGILYFNTVLGDDNSVTDRLIVKGNTSGTTWVSVSNVGGSGRHTLNGIELISVEGKSDGEFIQTGRIAAGAYDYTLNRGLAGNSNNWYLSNKKADLEPVYSDEIGKETFRPEGGSYMANIAAASKLFNLSLEDREGRAENSSMWLRQQGNRTQFRDSRGQLKTATNSYIIQGGGEVADTQFTDTDRLGVGLMLGYGKSDSQSGNNRSGYSAKATVDGYSGGVYASWYQDFKTLNGIYFDSWMQYSLLNATVNGEQLSGESYNINGLSASLESGYRIPVYQGENGDVFVTPQAQIIWNNIEADDHTEANGTRTKSDANNNIHTRLGVKLSRDGVSDKDKYSDKLFTLYLEANWLHNTRQAGATMDGVSIRQAGNTNVAELKVGAEGQLTKRVNVWANVAQQIGNEGYSDTGLTIGFKYAF